VDFIANVQHRTHADGATKTIHERWVRDFTRKRQRVERKCCGQSCEECPAGAKEDHRETTVKYFGGRNLRYSVVGDYKNVKKVFFENQKGWAYKCSKGSISEEVCGEVSAASAASATTSATHKRCSSWARRMGDFGGLDFVQSAVLNLASGSPMPALVDVRGVPCNSWTAQGAAYKNFKIDYFQDANAPWAPKAILVQRSGGSQEWFFFDEVLMFDLARDDDAFHPNKGIQVLERAEGGGFGTSCPIDMTQTPPQSADSGKTIVLPLMPWGGCSCCVLDPGAREAKQKMERFFKQIASSRSQDGLISPAEFMTINTFLATSAGAGGSAEELSPEALTALDLVFKQYDQDGDNNLDPNEFLVYTVDNNEDGHLSIGELAKMHKLMGRTDNTTCAKCLAATQLDMDMDGLVSAAEFALWSTDPDVDNTTSLDAVASAAFGRVDIDGDGTLSLNEIESATALLASRGGSCAAPSTTQDVIQLLSASNLDANLITKADYTMLIREKLVGKKGSKKKYERNDKVVDAAGTSLPVIPGRRLRGTF